MLIRLGPKSESSCNFEGVPDSDAFAEIGGFDRLEAVKGRVMMNFCAGGKCMGEVKCFCRRVQRPLRESIDRENFPHSRMASQLAPNKVYPYPLERLMRSWAYL